MCLYNSVASQWYGWIIDRGDKNKHKKYSPSPSI